MDSELKQYLEAMEVRLAGIETRIMERVDGRLDAVETRLKDFIREADRDLETRIVGEFSKWGRTSDMRTKQALEHIGAFGERPLACGVLNDEKRQPRP